MATAVTGIRCRFANSPRILGERKKPFFQCSHCGGGHPEVNSFGGNRTPTYRPRWFAARLTKHIGGKGSHTSRRSSLL